MKKLITITTIAYCLLATGYLHAQAPNAIPYQAVARDASGNVIANQSIRLRLTVASQISLAPLIIYANVYQEVHTVTTSPLGLFTVNVGQGTPQGQYLPSNFANINWGVGAYSLDVEMDATGGTNYVTMGTNPFNSVPYALYAAKSGNGMPSGANGQTLRNDGTNYVSTSNLYNDGTNIGVGTTNPQAKLDVAGTTKTTNFQMTSGAGLNRVLTSDNAGNASWQPASGGGGGSLPSATNGQTMYYGFGQTGPAWVASSLLHNAGTRIGVGTTTPEFRLSIGEDNGLDGSIMAKGGLSPGSSLTTTGAGTRMFWYPRKSAFRAGAVSASQWDDANIGIYSFATGFDAKASNLNSIAMGKSVTASGPSSVAIGDEVTADGLGSVAMGYNASTDGKDGAFVLGDASNPGYPLIPNVSNSFNTRFAGGYAFHSDAALGGDKMMYFADGNLSIGLGYYAASKLDVDGQVTIRGGNPQTGYVLTATGATGTAVWSPATGGLANGIDAGNTPYWNGTAWVTTSSNIFNLGGGVGIGTSIPSASLDVANSGLSEIKISSTSNSGVGPSRLSMISNKGTINEWRPGYIESGDNGDYAGRLDFYTNSPGPTNAFDSYLGMSVTNGKVGIGTTTPQTTLDVNGSMKYKVRRISNPPTNGASIDLAITDGDNVIAFVPPSLVANGDFNITGIVSTSHIEGRILHIVLLQDSGVITLKGWSPNTAGTQFHLGYAFLGPIDKNIGGDYADSITLMEMQAAGGTWYWIELK